MLTADETSSNILISTHRGAILWYLSKKLSEISEMQRNQQETRLMREVEKSKRYLLVHSVYNCSMMNKASQRNQYQSRATKEVKAEQQFESTLSQEQLQMLEQENHSMIEGFEQTLDQIKYYLKLYC
jgi:syntaxin 18